MAFRECPLGPGYLDASFQGLSFYIESATLTVHPGSATSEFPFRPLPASIDTSRKAEDYSFEGWITGADLRAQIAAFRLAASGPQPFIYGHPTFGPLVCGGKSLKFHEDYIKENQVCKISFEGFEWGVLPSGGSSGNFFLAVSGLIAIAASSFLSRYTVQDIPAFQRPTVEQAYNRVVGNVQRFVAAAGEPSSVVSTVNDWQEATTAWPAISTPLIEFSNVSSSGFRAMNGLVKSLGITVPPGSTQTALDALYQSPRLLAITALGNAMLAGDYVTPGEVCDARDAVLRPLFAELRAASVRGDVDMMRAIDNYQREFTSLVMLELVTKAAVVTHEFPAVTNSIAIAHELYGDGSRFREIEHLNPQYLPSNIKGRVFALAN